MRKQRDDREKGWLGKVGKVGRWGGGMVVGKGDTGADGFQWLGSLLGRFLKADTNNTEKCSCVLGFASF